jgi:hypothetical protein
MSPREANVLWLRDILEHLSTTQKQLEWVQDPETAVLLTDSMIRDLDRCRRLCESIRRRQDTRQTV